MLREYLSTKVASSIVKYLRGALALAYTAKGFKRDLCQIRVAKNTKDKR
jgi:hypothetical protein